MFYRDRRWSRKPKKWHSLAIPGTCRYIHGDSYLQKYVFFRFKIDVDVMYNITYELETLLIGLYVNVGLILIVNKV